MTTWLTPELFDLGMRLDRKYGDGGFGVLLSAANTIAAGRLRQRISQQWALDDLSSFAATRGEEAAKYEGAPALAWLVAAYSHADSRNQQRLEDLLPGIGCEFVTRYNTAASLMPGEVTEVDGALYLCIGTVTEGDYGYQVNTEVEEVFA